MKNIKIEIAQKAGFCFGVQRAVELVEESLKDSSKEIYCQGDLIHNPKVVNSLKRKGMGIIQNLKELPHQATFVVRSHGIVLGNLQKAQKKTSKIVDATCPFVKQAQKAAQNFYKQGRQVVILGDEDHAEVKGIESRINNKAWVVGSFQSLKKKLDSFKKMPPIGIVCQTTQKKSKLKKIEENLKNTKVNFEIKDTICSGTSKKQDEIKQLEGVDLLIIIGGFHSSNTSKLAEIGRNKKIKTYHIEKTEDISPEWFHDNMRVFLATGASTPIKEAFKAKKIIENFE